MVKSTILYSPQNFVEAVTGYCYIFRSDNVAEQIAKFLKQNGYSDLFDYPLDEIDHIVENNINVVLVDVSCFDKHGIWHHEIRWFEVPENFSIAD